ncbi:MAG: isoprenyl transferase [Planctomycetota bacterium]|jgi:undecaprenyl diphosphate synthase
MHTPHPDTPSDGAPATPPTLPRHIAVIMDGNGRWAQQRGADRSLGHQKGAEAVKPIMYECNRLGVEALTLYSFSTENWKRPAEEVDFLMKLGHAQLLAEGEQLTRDNIRFRHIGRKEGIPVKMLAAIEDLERVTASNTGLTLALALNYGARLEITDAMRTIAQRVAEGKLDPHRISEQTISDSLYTAGLPNPDLLIRTAGEMRISNFLLWQISYTELWVTETCWPDFDVETLHRAIDDYANRKRRFGGVPTVHS